MKKIILNNNENNYEFQKFNQTEFNFLTKNVNEKLKKYIYNFIFPEYDKNDKGHGIVHIFEVIRRSFELNSSLCLNLNDDLIFTIASCHDNGKYIDHENHEKIAAQRFYNDEFFNTYFSETNRKIIKEAIEDHRSSFSNTPRSDYGKLISSADRNSTIEIVFIRSFFVGQVRTPEMTIDDFLNYTLDRLRKRYSEEKSENMFYIDTIYSNFLSDMRKLLQNEILFKELYCKVNNINNTKIKLKDMVGD